MTQRKVSDAGEAADLSAWPAPFKANSSERRRPPCGCWQRDAFSHYVAAAISADDNGKPEHHLTAVTAALHAAMKMLAAPAELLDYLQGCVRKGIGAVAYTVIWYGKHGIVEKVPFDAEKAARDHTLATFPNRKSGIVAVEVRKDDGTVNSAKQVAVKAQNHAVGSVVEPRSDSICPNGEGVWF
ncbi:hypothetical protein [Mesorhizobium caraganae]|uniref:hypothetical protein n=1 Tax=Mesorhizobium caraganae TaxID=483206 RepID=UPI00333CFB41